MKTYDRLSAREHLDGGGVTLPKLHAVMTTLELIAMLAPRLAEKCDQAARAARSRRS